MVSSDVRRVVLFLGLPAFVARRLLLWMLERWDDAVFVVLLHPRHEKATEAWLAALAPAFASRIRTRVGRVTALDLGLSGPEVVDLLDRVTHVVHAAAILDLGQPPEKLEKVNVTGARHVMDFCREARHRPHLAYFGSVHVSGTRTGVVREQEFDRGQGFKNPLEHSLYRAERILRREMRGEGAHPITIFRLGNVVGDSKTGEIGELEGPYRLIRVLQARDFNLPPLFPGSGRAPAHLVPVDYVVQAAVAILDHPGAVGQTFHLVDPAPLPTHRVVKMLCAQLGCSQPIFGVPSALVRMTLALPAVAQYVGVDPSFFDYVNHRVEFRSSTAEEYLHGTGIACPPLESYFRVCVEYAVRRMHRLREQQDAVRAEDALDGDPRPARERKSRAPAEDAALD